MNNPQDFSSIIIGLSTICRDIEDYEILDRMRHDGSTSFKIKHKETDVIDIMCVADHDYSYLNKAKQKSHVGFFILNAREIKNCKKDRGL